MIILKKQKQLLFDANVNLLSILEEFLKFSEEFKDLSLYAKIQDLVKEIKTATSKSELSCEIIEETPNPFSEAELENTLLKLQIPVYFKQYEEYITVVQKMKFIDEQLKITKQITLVTNLINEKKKLTELYNKLHPQFLTKVEAIKSEMPEIKQRYKTNKLASWDPKLDLNRVTKSKKIIKETFVPIVKQINYEFFANTMQISNKKLLELQEESKNAQNKYLLLKNELQNTNETLLKKIEELELKLAQEQKKADQTEYIRSKINEKIMFKEMQLQTHYKEKMQKCLDQISEILIDIDQGKFNYLADKTVKPYLENIASVLSKYKIENIELRDLNLKLNNKKKHYKQQYKEVLNKYNDLRQELDVLKEENKQYKQEKKI